MQRLIWGKSWRWVSLYPIHPGRVGQHAGRGRTGCTVQVLERSPATVLPLTPEVPIERSNAGGGACEDGDHPDGRLHVLRGRDASEEAGGDLGGHVRHCLVLPGVYKHLHTLLGYPAGLRCTRCLKDIWFLTDT